MTLQNNFAQGLNAFNSFENKFNTGLDKIQRKLNGLSVQTFISNVNAAASGLESINNPGLQLSSSMADLEAITGVTGQKLKEIEGYARENAKTFGGEASQSAESYKLILSQLSPEIAKMPSALKAMGKEVSVTSKLMGGDSVAATNVLTTAMNQYQVSLQNPIQASKEMARMNNVMAAAAKEGSAELPQIGQALENSGLAAKTANVSFEETNGWIQVLDKNGKKGAEGGIALRNVLATLAQGRFLPKDARQELAAAGVNVNDLTDQSKTLAERLKPLQNIMGDQALITKLFGKENSNAAIAMISNIAEAERLTKAITGTNTAYEQAAIIMESPAEKNKRLQAQVDDFKISLFNGTGGLIGYASVLGRVAGDFANLMPILSGGVTIIQTLTSAQKMQALWTGVVSGATAVWTGIQMAFNAVMAMNPIVLIVLAVVALVAAIVWVASKTEGWGKLWHHTVNGAKLIFLAYIYAVQANFNTMINGMMIGINKIQIGWYKFKNAMKLGDKSENNAMINQLNQDVEARKKSIKDGYKKAYDTAVQAKNEFQKGLNAVKWKKDEKAPGAVQTGIAPAGNSLVPTMGSKTAIVGGGAQKTNEAIATGGTKHNYITIHLKSLIEYLEISKSNFDESTDEMQLKVQDSLMRILATATTAT